MDMNKNKTLTSKISTLICSCLFTTMAAASSTSYTYNQFGQILTIDGPRVDLSDVTTFSYDAQGNRTSITNALGHTTQITAHDDSGRPLTIVDPNGVATELTYDPLGRLLTRTTDGQTTSMQYDVAGNLTRITQADGSYINYEYDQADRLIALEDNSGNRIEYTLDAAGNRLEEHIKDPGGQLTYSHQSSFDALSRLHTSTGSSGQTTEYGYDPNGNLTQSTDALNRSSSHSYDALDRLTNSLDPAQGTTSYSYDAQDNLISVTDPNGNTTQYSYDGLGNRTQLQSPDTGTTGYTYDEAGNLINRTDANGNTTQYSYDALNRLLQSSYQDGSTIQYSYDQGGNGIGRLSAIQDSSGVTISYQYDTQGRLSQKSQGLDSLTLALGYGYDQSGRLSSITYPSGAQLNYSYNSNGQLENIQLNGQPLISNISYQPFGPITGWQWAGGPSHTRSYDLDGQLTVHSLGPDQRSLSYDAVGNITGQTDSQDNLSYSYDELDRLINATGTELNQQFQYDANGNRTQLQDGTETINYSIDTASNRLLQVDTSNYQYDANGNLINDGSHSYQYDARNRLISVDNGDSASYLHNALGQRVKKESSGGIDYQALADQYNQQAQAHRDQATALQAQVEQKRAEADTHSQQAQELTQQAAELTTQAQEQNELAQTYTTSAQELQTQADELAQQAQEMRDRIVENPTGWWAWLQRLLNSIYQWIADYWQEQADDYAQQAQQQQQLADQATQQAQSLTQQATELNTQAQEQSQLAQTLNQEADALQAQADQETQLAAEDQQQADYYAQLAQDPNNAPQSATYFLYGEGGELLGEYDQDGTPIQEIIYLGGMPVVLNQDSTLYAIHPDHLGTPRIITDYNNQIVWRWVSDPFGTTQAEEDPDNDGNTLTFNLRFPGQYYDQETGLHYNYFRDYNPATGRYVESDPIGLRGGINTYWYVGGNSLSFGDPFGLKIIGNWIQFPSLADYDTQISNIALFDGGVRVLPPAVSIALVTVDIDGVVQGVIYCRETDDCTGKTIDRWIISPSAEFNGQFQFHVPYRIGPFWWSAIWVVIDTGTIAYKYHNYLDMLALDVIQELLALTPTQWCKNTPRK